MGEEQPPASPITSLCNSVGNPIANRRFEIFNGIDTAKALLRGLRLLHDLPAPLQILEPRVGAQWIRRWVLGI